MLSIRSAPKQIAISCLQSKPKKPINRLDDDYENSKLNVDGRKMNVFAPDMKVLKLLSKQKYK